MPDPTEAVRPDLTNREMGSLGGHARAERLSPERRSEIAAAAAHKRWNRKKQGIPPDFDALSQPDTVLGQALIQLEAIDSAQVVRALSEKAKRELWSAIS